VILSKQSQTVGWLLAGAVSGFYLGLRQAGDQPEYWFGFAVLLGGIGFVIAKVLQRFEAFREVR
jgi:hypothetical protein